MRLWNAHRRVYLQKQLPFADRLRLQSEPSGWRTLLSEDVVKYVDTLKENRLAGTREQQEKRIRCLLHNTPRFFSQPKNVPLEMRKQIYLPDFVITLIRSPKLAPKYACFWVPLWFNKLDFKSYLKNVYNVDVLHIRSYVQQAKVKRNELDGRRQGHGSYFRPPARKKMTVELVDPFIFPEQAKDLSPWDAEFKRREESERREMARDSPLFPRMEANAKARKSIAQQAQDFLDGKKKWKPSWQSIAADVEIMRKTSNPPGALRGSL